METRRSEGYNGESVLVKALELVIFRRLGCYPPYVTYGSPTGWRDSRSREGETGREVFAEEIVLGISYCLWNNRRGAMSRNGEFLVKKVVVGIVLGGGFHISPRICPDAEGVQVGRAERGRTSLRRKSGFGSSGRRW